jgi:serine kinase of HPr protein (carbohydrate metabolism regulator)
MTTRAKLPSRRRARRVLTGTLVVLATVGLLVAGQGGAPVALRLTAGGVALVAAATSFAVARRKGDLAGWYAIAVALLVWRLLRGH